MVNKTIAAISSPIGPGGIGIVRISGPDALSILQTLFVFTNKKPTTIRETGFDFSSHHVYHGYIHEFDGPAIIDEVITFYMAGPRSYTREDVVEIQCHSGYVVLDRILSAVVDAGAELAKPGEFTQRAFLNGRIDLTQAEAIIDLINAPCETAAKIAVQQAAGGIKLKIDQLAGQTAELYARCEALIEFDESDDLAISKSVSEIKDAVYRTLVPAITKMIQSQKDKAVFSDGVLMAIAGVPNVGKSSLLNQLVEKEIAIVSDIPGTTRDVVREYHSINGIPVTLCDTAGLHDTQDPLECIGIEKAHDHIHRAELILFVVDGTRSLNVFEEHFLRELSEKPVIVVVNKDDIADRQTISAIKKTIVGFTHIAVSAKTGSGLSELKGLIFKTLVSDPGGESASTATPNLRQRKSLEKIEQLILSEIAPDGSPPAPELLSDTLERIRRLLYEITGTTENEDIYDYIFSQFCVGK